ncbi:MAG: transposase [Candidatus Sulfotelmatobacter sp.]
MTVSTEREVHFSVPSVLSTNRKTIATSVRLASSSTTGGRVYRNRASNYIGTRKKCGPCALRPQCTSAAFRGLVIHQNEPARQRARELVNTPEFAKAQRQRKKVEALFAELKNQIGLRRLRLRRLRFVREQFFLAAVAQSIKRLVRFLSQPTTPALLATT